MPKTGFYMNRRFIIAALPLFLLLLTACTAGRINNPEGWSGGAISGDTLYIGTRNGDVRALERSSGATLWKTDEGEIVNEEFPAGFYGSPVVVDDTVLIGGYDGFVYAISDGNRIANWPEGINDPVGPIVATLAVEGDIVLVSSSDSNIYALELVQDDDGVSFSEKWRYSTGNRIWSSPAVANGVVYFGSMDKSVYAVRLEDGTKLWDFPTGGSVVAPPLVENGRVYIGSFDSRFYALDASTGQQVWSFDEAGSWYWGKALIVDSIVHVASLDGNLYALDKNTGEFKWLLETEGPIIGSPIDVLDMIAVPSEDGRLYLASTSDGTPLDSCNLGEEILTSLVEQDGSIYLGASDNSIRSLKIKSNGNPDEEWAHFTNEDDPIVRGRTPDC